MISVTKLNDRIYLLDDAGESTGYVIVGTKAALVVDTMYGRQDVRALAATITDLPLTLINTHAHPDHIAGNHFFDEAYVHPADFPLIERYMPPEHKANAPRLIAVQEGDQFDLGGLHTEIYDMPGHTPGEICILLREERALLTGDGINRHLWMQLDECLALEQYSAVLARLEPVVRQADCILHSHAKRAEDISLYYALKKGIDELVAQTGTQITDADAPYKWFGGVDKMHAFDDKGSVICYRANRIH